MSSRPLSRRTVLKGLGTAIALPWLEAMWPSISLAGGPSKRPPKRLAFLYVPNGAHMAAWTPGTEGSDFQLPSTLEPLAPYRKDLLILSGLALDAARPHGDGGGDHARAMSAFLTGRHPRKTYGADIRVGLSVDQLAAQKVGQQTRFPSLELGCDPGLQAGNCDSGYSCAYSTNLSWRSESTPMAQEVNPRLLFERLVSNQAKEDVDANRAKRQRYRKSVLDFVSDDAHQLRNLLGSTDQRKVDEYLNSVRELEIRVARNDSGTTATNLAKPAGIPKEYPEHIHLMADLLVLAFQGDMTRIATFVMAHDGSNRSYRFIGVPEGHHDLSHHGGNKSKQEKIAQINCFHISKLAYLLEKLKNIREGDGCLLDSCMIVYGSGISDGNRHNHEDLPILLAGGGGGTLHGGRHVRYKEVPLTNLYLALLDRFGVPTDSFADSTGKLESLT